MRIRYKGNATVRTIMQYRWDKANGYVCDVPEALAANLLTYPRPDFELAERNPQMATARIERSLSDKSKPRSTRRHTSHAERPDPDPSPSYLTTTGETSNRPGRLGGIFRPRGAEDEEQG
jgi:hypothetical protein